MSFTFSPRVVIPSNEKQFHESLNQPVFEVVTARSAAEDSPMISNESTILTGKKLAFVFVAM